MSALIPDNNPHTRLRKQRGAVLMVMLVILIVGASAMLLNTLNSATPQLARAKITAEALARAKEALIAYSANSNTPGQLPCPENTGSIGFPLEGQAQAICSNTVTEIGRLPWRTLGLGPIRDGNGDLLWYALSPGFRSSTVNSETQGQLTVDGNANSAVAIIFSAGPPLSGQTRPIPTAPTPPVLSQYLDLSNNDGDDSFITSSPSNIFNDRLLLVTHNNLFSVVEKRVAAEVKQCLNEYAANSQNKGRYPWPAKLNPAAAVSYIDSTNFLFGRIPDTLFSNTCLNSGGNSSDPGPGPGPNPNYCTNTPTTGMNNTWTGTCTIISSAGWWLNWKEMVFYGIGDAYKPITPLSVPPANACATLGACLTVTPPSANADKKFVVIVSGQKLTGQNRSGIPASGVYATGILSNYLEGANADGSTPFEQQPNSTSFNDTVIFQ